MYKKNYSILMKLGLAIPLLLAASLHVSALTFGQTFTFNRGNLPCGLYIADLTQGNKLLAIKKIIITD